MGYSASRSSNVLPPSPSERAPAPTLCSLGAPKLRNLIAAPCFYLSAFVTRLLPSLPYSLRLLQTVKLPALVTRSSLTLATKLYQFFATRLSLLPDFRCCPRQPRICPCYQTLSICYLTVHVTSFLPLPICPCYQIFTAVLDSPEFW